MLAAIRNFLTLVLVVLFIVLLPILAGFVIMVIGLMYVINETRIRMNYWCWRCKQRCKGKLSKLLRQTRDATNDIHSRTSTEGD